MFHFFFFVIFPFYWLTFFFLLVYFYCSAVVIHFVRQRFCFLLFLFSLFLVFPLFFGYFFFLRLLIFYFFLLCYSHFHSAEYLSVLPLFCFFSIWLLKSFSFLSSTHTSTSLTVTISFSSNISRKAISQLLYQPCQFSVPILPPQHALIYRMKPLFRALTLNPFYWFLARVTPCPLYSHLFLRQTPVARPPVSFEIQLANLLSIGQHRISPAYRTQISFGAKLDIWPFWCSQRWPFQTETGKITVNSARLFVDHFNKGRHFSHLDVSYSDPSRMPNQQIISKVNANIK